MIRYIFLGILVIASLFVSPELPSNRKVIKVAEASFVSTIIYNKVIWSNTKLSNNYLQERINYAYIFEKVYKVPVKVQLAVDLLESGFDVKKSQFNNDSWVTCKCNNNKKLRKEHSHLDVCFKAYDKGDKKWYYFKKYKSIAGNWHDKARIISNYKWFKPNQSFEFYAKHLQGTYATSKRYTELLCKINDKYLKNMKYDLLY